MKRMLIKRSNSVFFALLAAVLCSSLGYGQAFKIDGSDGRWVTIGGGLRTNFDSKEVGPGTYAQTFSLDSLRLYVNAEVHKDFQVELNTEIDQTNGSAYRVLDAVVKYQPNEMINIWVGRHITPSDRANLDGPFFQSVYTYPTLVSRYPAIFAGRDDGISASGKIQKGRAKWAFGVYNGQNPASVPGSKKHLLYAGRVTVNVFDSEPDAGGKSGYYTASTYYGEKDQILALGFASQYQDEIVMESGRAAGFVGFNADVLYEKKLADKSVITVEGAFYKYNIGRSGIVAGSNLAHGSAFMMSAAYLFPLEVGRGKFQPIARYQDFRDSATMDIGTNYVIRGHNARLSFLYSPTYFGGAWKNRANNYQGGVQLQF